MKDFKWKNLELDLENIQSFCLEFGSENATPTGATAIDDFISGRSHDWGTSIYMQVVEVEPSGINL